MKKPFLFVLLAILSAQIVSDDFRFETDFARLLIDSSGQAKSLQARPSRTEWLDSRPTPLFAVKKHDKWYPSRSMQPEGQWFQVDFGSANVKALYAITNHNRYIVFELVKLHGEEIQAVRLLNLRTKGLSTAGRTLAVRRNEQFAVSAMGLSQRVHSTLLKDGAVTATVYPEFGMVGEKIAFLAVPTSRFLDSVEIVEKDFDLPSPTIGGHWAKRSADIRTSYLFIDLTTWNVDDVIRYAKLGGFKYILINAGTWSSSLGSYPVKLKNFPLGERSLKSVVEKVHDAGLKVGIHTLTSFISKNDPLVRPIPDSRLLKDAEAILAAGLNAEATEIPVTSPLQGFPSKPSYYGSPNAGMDVQIDDEIIQCKDIGLSNANWLLRCERGFAGTKAKYHAEGSTVYHLAERYGSYLADLRTSLKERISERISSLVERLELDMIYFDGGVANSANGPAWFWVSQQQDDTLRRINRDILTQGSGMTHWTWHWFARGACDDYASIATVPYLDHYKIPRQWRSYRNNFMPAELGWWAILDTTVDHPATTPEEVEHHAIRMISLDTPISLQTTVSRLESNGRADEMLELLGQLEKLRLKGGVLEDIRQRLREGHWHWDPTTGQFHSVLYSLAYSTFPFEFSLPKIRDKSPIMFRLEVLPALSDVGASDNISLFRARDTALVLPAPERKTAMPGALIYKIKFHQSRSEQTFGYPTGQPDSHDHNIKHSVVDLTKHRALAIRIRTKGKVHEKSHCYPILNVQLESNKGNYRDYHVNLDRVGQTTQTIFRSNVAKMLPDLMPSPSNYRVKRAVRNFDFSSVSALNLRWTRHCNDSPISVELLFIEALTEKKGVINNPSARLLKTDFTIDTVLTGGDYLEITKNGPIHVFRKNGRMLSQKPLLGIVPALRSGENSDLLLDGTGNANIRVKVISRNNDASH